ncbi:MAG: proteinral secretion pathway protein G [Caulobacteraceae bacterium]|nr:MAG: proteinral secretion pathway protein G [Caulobacteraceae bacterium]
MIKGVTRRRRTSASVAASAPAYTLTEMLVVLVIVGLLAAVVGPRLFGRLDDAKQRTARLQLTNLETAIDLFRLDVGRLPTEEEGLEVLVTAPEDGSAWLGPYLARGRLPLDPWGNAFVYELDAHTEHYRLIALGSDKKVGGAGKAADISIVSDENSSPDTEGAPARGQNDASSDAEASVR